MEPLAVEWKMDSRGALCFQTFDDASETYLAWSLIAIP